MNILIIKTGKTETFDRSNVHPEVVSLGDVLRTTVLLHALKGHSVSWLTHPSAFLLLEGLEEIKVLHQDLKSVSFNQFDLILNLERDEEVFTALSAVSHKKIIGFRDRSEALYFLDDHVEPSFEAWVNRENGQSKNWSEKLYLLVNKQWSGENYCLSGKHLNQSSTDQLIIGLNWQVGIKWPTKTWPLENWQMLAERMRYLHSVSWQEGFNNLTQYMNWINSLQVVVTHDSLGLHIARALNKKVLGLFGPTASREIHMGEGIALSESEKAEFQCPPCYKDKCHNIIHCMKSLSVDEVEKNLRILLRGSNDKSSA